MSSFTCPFCGCTMSISNANHKAYFLTFSGYHATPHGLITIPYLEVEIYHCPNSECRKESIIASGKNGYMENSRVNIYPNVQAKYFPDYIPENIRNDYIEACAVLRYSPKAAATLARRCLQGMIRDFWGIREANLYTEINALSGRLPSRQWEAIDALRQIGNIGAHMEKDVNLILDISYEDASKIIHLVELFLDRWYVNRHDEDELLNGIIATNQRLQENKMYDRDKE